MTTEEKKLLNELGKIWNKFNDLPELHAADRQDFCFHIHALQNIIFAREGMRSYKEDHTLNEKGEIN